jgi:hypothetical protein
LVGQYQNLQESKAKSLSLFSEGSGARGSSLRFSLDVLELSCDSISTYNLTPDSDFLLRSTRNVEAREVRMRWEEDAKCQTWGREDSE